MSSETKEKCRNEGCVNHTGENCKDHKFENIKNCHKFTITPTTSIDVESLEGYKTQEHNLNVFNENYKRDQAKITELEAQVAELRKDRERLDWAEGWDYIDIFLDDNFAVISTNQTDADGDTIREAIDKAMG